MGLATPPKKKRRNCAVSLMCTRARVCVWLPLFEEEEWGWAALGFGTRREVALPGLRPTIKNAVKFFSYSSSLSRRRRLPSSGFFRLLLHTKPIRSLTSSPPWHFHLLIFFSVCDIPSLHLTPPILFFSQEEDNQLLPLNNDNEIL